MSRKRPHARPPTRRFCRGILDARAGRFAGSSEPSGDVHHRVAKPTATDDEFSVREPSNSSKIVAMRRAAMGQVTSEISMSLDGFITGPNVRVDNGMGDGGDRLHDWMFDAKTETDAAIVNELYASTGAVLIGKRMFDVGFEPWGDPPPFRMPVFVVTHQAREPLPMQGGTTYTFVTDGIEAALELARAAAGDKDVGIWGGANILREYLRARLVDEMQIHLVPILLGGGVRLFEDLGSNRIELRRVSSIETPSANHFRFEVVK
jgi:dihydrofolate reductase